MPDSIVPKRVRALATRRRSVDAPTATDVPTVNPAAARDPGLDVPAGAPAPEGDTGGNRADQGNARPRRRQPDAEQQRHQGRRKQNSHTDAGEHNAGRRAELVGRRMAGDDGESVDHHHADRGADQKPPPGEPQESPRRDTGDKADQRDREGYPQRRHFAPVCP